MSIERKFLGSLYWSDGKWEEDFLDRVQIIVFDYAMFWPLTAAKRCESKFIRAGLFAIQIFWWPVGMALMVVISFPSFLIFTLASMWRAFQEWE